MANTRQRKASTRTASEAGITADEHVLPYVQQQRTFSTGSVARHFNIAPGSAVALMAILRIKRVIERNGEATDGTSKWLYTG